MDEKIRILMKKGEDRLSVFPFYFQSFSSSSSACSMAAFRLAYMMAKISLSRMIQFQACAFGMGKHERTDETIESGCSRGRDRHFFSVYFHLTRCSGESRGGALLFAVRDADQPWPTSMKTAWFSKSSAWMISSVGTIVSSRATCSTVSMSEVPAVTTM